MEHIIKLEELLKQADDENEFIKKSEENSVTIGKVIASFGRGMESYIKATQSFYGRLPNDDERRAVIAMANAVLKFIGVKEAFGLDAHDFAMASIAMWCDALANCGYDPENTKGTI